MENQLNNKFKIYEAINILKNSIEDLIASQKEERKENEKYKIYINGKYAGGVGALSYSISRPIVSWDIGGSAIRGKKIVSCVLVGTNISEKFTNIVAGDRLSIIIENPLDGESYCIRLTHIRVISPEGESDEYNVYLSAEDVEIIIL